MTIACIDINDSLLLNVISEFNNEVVIEKNMNSGLSYDFWIISEQWYVKHKSDHNFNAYKVYVLVETINESMIDEMYEAGVYDVLRQPLSRQYIIKRLQFMKNPLHNQLDFIEAAGEIGVFKIDYLTGKSFISPYILNLFDLPSNSEIKLESLDQYIHPEDRVFVMGLYQKKYLNHMNYTMDYKIITAKKHLKHIRKKVVFHLQGDLCVQAYGTFRDVSEEIEYKDTINELGERMGLAVEAAEIGIWDYDITSGDLIWDPHMFKLHHLRIDTQMLDMNDWMNYISQQDRQKFIDNLKAAVNHHQKMEISYSIPKDDHVSYLRATATVSMDNLSATRLIGVCYDVTERVLREKHLSSLNEALENRVKERTAELEKAILNRKIAQARLESSLNVANVGFWEWYVDEGWSYESKQWFEMLGRNKSDYRNSTAFFHNLMHPDDEPHMREVLEEVATGKRQEIQEEFRLKHLDGHYEWIMARGRIIEYQSDGKAKMVSGVHINISYIKEKEKQVNLLYSAVSASPLGVVITDSEGFINYANESFEKITGYAMSEILGYSCGILKSGYHDDAFYENLWQTIKDKKQWKGEFLNKRKNGDLYWESASISPILNEQGEVFAFVTLKEDITSKKEHENEMILRNKRLTRQQWMLQHLTRNSDLTQSNMHAGLTLITEAICNALEVSHSYIGFFEEMDSVLVCESCYDAVEKTFFICERIQHKDFSNYFYDMLAGNLITLSKDQRSNAYKDMKSYLEKQNIYASLHFPIRLRGQVIGVVRAGHEIDDRPWLTDEISFLRSISDLITIVLETHERIKAQNKAEEATKVKSSFLANMSHEIRTPLNAIVGLSHLMLKSKLNDQQVNYMTKINNASNHLMVIINDILDFSKAEAGKVTLENIPYSLIKVLNNLKSMVEKDIQEKQLYFKYTINNNTPTNLIGDPYRLTQILLNLVSNAIKFTKHGGVEIIVDRVYSDMNNDEIVMIQFQVIDTGKGMDKNTMNTLFDSFEQGDSSITREYGGSGLGLSICKHLVELFGGHIDVNSELNRGSQFNFTINATLNEAHYETIETEMEQLETKHQISLAIVDDNDINREIICEFLKPHGYLLKVFSNGQDLISYLEQGNMLSLILMDLHMPMMDGFETASMIRSKQFKNVIPIIAISADSEMDVKDQMIEAGINDYVSKPILEASLLDKVKKWLVPVSFQNIKHLDVEKGLKHCNNNMELYVTVLEKITQKYALEKASDHQELLLNLHTLKGLMKNIGNDYLADQLAKFEKQAKENQLDKMEFEKLIHQYNRFTDQVSQGLKVFSHSESKAFKKDNKKLVELLNALKQPLKSGMINDIQILQNQINKMYVQDGIALPIKQLDHAIKKYKFDAAQVIIAAILDEIGET
ncbi:MAG: PAS domain-containing protein [Clostridia bacterium]|nr:PAS domain-containing protein [Clostridia bacterium]